MKEVRVGAVIQEFVIDGRSYWTLTTEKGGASTHQSATAALGSLCEWLVAGWGGGLRLGSLRWITATQEGEAACNEAQKKVQAVIAGKATVEPKS